jgi:hypothetical protein
MMDDATLPDARPVRYQAVGMDLAPRADTDVSLDHGKWPDPDIVRKLRLRIDYGCGVDDRQG